MSAREFQWASELLDCKEITRDPITCGWGTFCPCVLFGTNVNRITDGQTPFMKACFMNFFMGGCLCWCCCLPFYAAPFREQLRRKKNLAMDPYSDIHTHMFCHPCALCQEMRQLDASESSAVAGPREPVIDRRPSQTKTHLEELRKTMEDPEREPVEMQKMKRTNSL